jgi:hypothetical protein
MKQNQNQNQNQNLKKNIQKDKKITEMKEVEESII